MTTRYSVKHTTTYTYAAVVHQSYHILHLTPRKTSHQIIHRHRLSATPAPSDRKDAVDYFGNPYSVLNVETDHQRLVVTSESEIEIQRHRGVDLTSSRGWEAVRDESRAGAMGENDVEVAQFIAASRHGRRIAAAADYARASFPAGCPILVGAEDLTRRIFEDFSFDPAATDVSTPVEQVLASRRGVCQDFAHLQISALRSLGLPARYVSGYILTHPPEGQERLQGADASHAWLSVWSPETGWVDFDPTNNVIPHGEHITIAYGRDYDDVSPISGVLLGGGAHGVDVAVDVVPVVQEIS